jgi:hypothetical protein
VLAAATVEQLVFLLYERFDVVCDLLVLHGCPQEL